MGHPSLSPKRSCTPRPFLDKQILPQSLGCESKSLLPQEQHKGDVEVAWHRGNGSNLCFLGSEEFKNNNFRSNKSQQCPEVPEISSAIDGELLSCAKPRTCTWSRFSDYSPRSQSPNPSVMGVPRHQRAPKSAKRVEKQERREERCKEAAKFHGCR